MWSVVQDEVAGGYEHSQRRKSMLGRTSEPEDPDFEEEVCSTFCCCGQPTVLFHAGVSWFSNKLTETC